MRRELPNYTSLNRTSRSLQSFFEKSADLFQNELMAISANQCKQKVPEFAAQLERYQKVIESYEETAQQSLTNNFPKTRESKFPCHLFCQDIAASINDEDVAKLTDVVREFDDMTLRRICHFLRYSIRGRQPYC
ncbi:hypothetical protein TIFTF001_042176 [Ficus carica]|uniref:Uncharacterized protein n=1 Tax=Ficus carica TaxID=3494 RepID=A0AA88CX40_FICCA|nr:hypothetical protein TIFTF001_042176 [Ficus carica]